MDIGEQLRAALAALVRGMAHAGGDARWVRPESMHATLKFLGHVEAARLEHVRNTVARAAGGHRVMQMRVRRIGGFPSLQRPRVLWAGIDCPGLGELARDIDAALAGIGFVPEERPFGAHITLARLRSLRGWEKLARAVQAHADDEIGQVLVSQIVIYRSILQPQGAAYTPLWTIPLAQHK